MTSAVSGKGKSVERKPSCWRDSLVRTTSASRRKLPHCSASSGASGSVLVEDVRAVSICA